MVVSIVPFYSAILLALARSMLGTKQNNFSILLSEYLLATLNSSLNAAVYEIFNKKCSAEFMKYFCFI